MGDRYDQIWVGLWSRRSLRWAIIFSLVVHAIALIVLWLDPLHKPQIAPTVFHEVMLYTPQAAPAKVKPAPPKEEPKPEPPKEEPKPEPEPVPEPEPPKPEPPKEEPKPVEEAVVKKEEPPKPKEEPKPKPKPKPLKLKDSEPEEVVKPLEVRDTVTPLQPMEPLELSEEPEATMTFQANFPTELDTWGSLVERKIRPKWAVPGGVRLSNVALVSFWVDRNGNLIDEPQVVKHANDISVGESAVRAIKLAAPFPPFPKSFKELEFNVIIEFEVK